MSAKKDATPALVNAMAVFDMTLPAGTPGPGVLDLLEIRKGIAHRLTKENMRGVWSYLKSRPVQEPYVFEQWRLWNAVLKAPDENALPAEKAAALLFHCAVNAFSCERTISIRSEIEKAAQPLSVAAEMCRRYPRIRKTGEELAEAERYAEHFEQLWKLNTRVDPFVVDRFGDDDRTRTRVLAFSAEMRKLYGARLYGVTAKIASSALDSTIRLTTVREWCKAR